jgi:hypothetical protein
MERELTAYHDRYTEGWRNNDPEAVMEQFTEGGSYIDPVVGGPISRDEVAELVRLTAARFPDIRYEERRVLEVDSANVRIQEWTMRGTHEGVLEGPVSTETPIALIPPTGNRIAVDGTSVVELSSEGITTLRAYYDPTQYSQQLGLTFPEVIGQLPSLAVGAIRDNTLGKILHSVRK